MIGVMRKVIRNNYIYRIILWMFLFMMAIGGGIAVNLGQEKYWVIKVYDNMLTDSKFRIMLQSAKKQQEEFRQKGIVFAGKYSEKDTVEGAVAGLLGDHVMDTMQLNVPDHLIEQGIQHHLAGLPNYFFKGSELNLELFKKYIAPYTVEGFIQDLYSEKKSKLFYDIVDLSIYTPEFELASQYQVDYSDKVYSIVTLPLQKFVAEAKQHAPSEEALVKFYKKPSNNEEFKTTEKRAGVMWSFDQQDYGITISDSEAKEYYDKNKQKYLISPSEVQVRILLLNHEVGKEAETRKKIEALREQAEKNPEDFSKLVKEFSQDKESAAKGGLTEFFAQDNKKLDPTMVKVAFESLSKDGQISVPIKTDRGYEIIQREKRKPAEYKELKVVEDDIKKELAVGKFKQRFQQDATRVINQAKYNPEVLKKFIERHKGFEKEVPLDVRKGVVGNHLFKIDEHKYTTFFDKSQGVLLLCTEIEKSVIPPLDKVEDKVLAKYYQVEGKKLLEDNLDQATKEVQDGQSVQEVAKKYGGKVQEATFEYKDGKTEQSPILNPQAVQAKLKTLSYQGAVTSVVSGSDGLIIRLDSISQSEKPQFNEKRDKLEKTLFYAKKYQVKEGFIASLYRRAKLDNKIEMKDEILHILKEA